MSVSAVDPRALSRIFETCKRADLAASVVSKHVMVFARGPDGRFVHKETYRVWTRRDRAIIIAECIIDVLALPASLFVHLLDPRQPILLEENRAALKALAESIVKFWRGRK